jgi:uncharacterized Rmd1/YagE family protein
MPEPDLINLNPERRNSGSTSSPSKEKRRTGFSKTPGGRKVVEEGEEEFEEEEWVPDVFLFEYGTVVIWGMTEREEKSFLRSL